MKKIKLIRIIIYSEIWNEIYIYTGKINVLLINYFSIK